MKKQTPEEKEKKLIEKEIISRFNSIRMKFSLGHIKSLKDYLLAFGYTLGEIEYAYDTKQLESPISFKELKEKQEEEIVRRISEEIQKVNDKILSPDTYDFEGITYQSNKGLLTKHEEVSSLSKDSESSQEDTTTLLISPKQKAKLFKFQSRAARRLLTNILDKNLRCQLLLSGAGTGKTFMIGAVLRQLYDIDFFKDSYSIWPAVWITKASIVEQTKRECEESFGLDVGTQVMVLNVEQLRSQFGEKFMVDKITYTEFGQEHEKFKWKPRVHPKVIILDESQLAKNEQSDQSKIIQALSEIPPEESVFIICASATPFCRPIEAKYMAVNTWKIIH